MGSTGLLTVDKVSLTVSSKLLFTDTSKGEMAPGCVCVMHTAVTIDRGAKQVVGAGTATATVHTQVVSQSAAPLSRKSLAPPRPLALPGPPGATLVLDAQ